MNIMRKNVMIIMFYAMLFTSAVRQALTLPLTFAEFSLRAISLN